MGSNRLHIRRFHAQYLVPHDHPAPQRLKVRIDDAVAQRLLGQTLSHALANFFSETDESIWLIRRLELNATVDAAWEPEQLTRVIAAQVARMLGAALQDETGDGNVVRFPNRAAYLARFLRDVAAGTAWGKWYYESFAGLRPLSTSAALRTAVCNEPDAGPEALLQLDDHELKRVLRALTEHDARRILDHLGANAGANDEVRCCEAAWVASRGIETFNTANEWSQVLHLFLITSRQQADVGGTALRRSVVALLQLQRLIAKSSPDQTQQILSALTNCNLASLHRAVGSAQAEKLAPLLLCPPTWVREVIETLLARKQGASSAETDRAGRRVTSFGGIFLLLPLVDELPLTEATHGWSSAADTAAINLVRYLLLIKCVGQKHAHNVFYDPLWRDLLLIPPAISPSVIGEWSAQITTAQVRSFLEKLVEWQRRRGVVQDRLQILARANLGDQSRAVLIDGARGNWLTVNAYAQDQPRSLAGSLRGFLLQLDSDSGILLCETSLLPALWAEFPTVRMIGVEDYAPSAVAGETNELAGIRARLDKLSDDVFHLALPDSLQLSSELDCALSVVSQNLLLLFSWRLPGFASSSLSYLSANFLDFSGSMEEEPERRVIRLGRPLLDLVMNLTGMSRQAYRLSWLDERSLSLFPED